MKTNTDFYSAVSDCVCVCVTECQCVMVRDSNERGDLL